MFRRASVLTLSLFAAACRGQTYGAGIGKSTWTSSDPVVCYDWMNKYLPVVDSAGNCDNHQCLVKNVVCNTQARSNLNNQEDFGLHMVNCTQHPTGSLSLSEVEAHFAAGVGDYSSFSPLMDYNTGLWSPDLDSFVKSLQADDYPFLALSWVTRGSTYYSIIVNACGFVQFEVMGDSLTATTATKYAMPRLDWTNTPTLNDAPDWTPLKVSRAATDIAAVRSYYIDTVNATLISESTYSDGTQRLELVIKPKANVHIQFWQHPTSTKISPSKALANATAGVSAWDVATLEAYILDVHASVYVTNVCGFDQYMDNHIAYNVNKQSADTRDLKTIADALEGAGHKIHWWASKGSGYVVYSPDPTGWIVGYYGDSDYAPKNAETYGANCASNNDCTGQGYCKDIARDPIVEGF